MKKVICNKSYDTRCPNTTCTHREPHYPTYIPIYPDSSCTDEGTCYAADEPLISNVRCVSIESKNKEKVTYEKHRRTTKTPRPPVLHPG